MSVGISKTSNDYANELLDIEGSKTVFMAIAFSLALQLTGTGNFEEAHKRVLSEWGVLNENGIVPQRPRVRKARKP